MYPYDRKQLDDLDFADDLALLSHTQQQMHENTTSVAVPSAAFGLNIHKGKSKILRYNTAYNNQITLDAEALEDAKTLTYLSSIIDEHDGSDVEVETRIGKARAAYLQLKNIRNLKQMSSNTKVRIFNTNVKTVLLYGLETWRTTKPSSRRYKCLLTVIYAKYF
ncbi:Laminin subunit gamma-1 [Schistosoma haematobium]|uniref:Laminin subunit gamma-1 n=1 Tax=Schistosoma haematobium TaxID=6185 RepID=A0A922LQP9_SCHHA|nr:Laminin subunit gamma-1 [Schistosoma haematobium]KAH9591541.1 Laminin subunit gamma-1 [Schistosoma haematobium]